MNNATTETKTNSTPGLNTYGVLVDSNTNEDIRPATLKEAEGSMATEPGHIDVDGRTCCVRQMPITATVGSVNEVWLVEDEEDDTDPTDAPSYYVSTEVSVFVGGALIDTHAIGIVVGCPDSEIGSLRASGAGVRPHCTAWASDYSDLEAVPEGARDAVLSACLDASWRLYTEAQDMVAKEVR